MVENMRTFDKHHWQGANGGDNSGKILTLRTSQIYGWFFLVLKL